MIGPLSGDLSTIDLVLPEGYRCVRRGRVETASPPAPLSRSRAGLGVLTRREGAQLVERFDLRGRITGDARHNDVWAFGTVLSEEVEGVKLVILDGGEATVLFDVPTPDSFFSARRWLVRE